MKDILDEESRKALINYRIQRAYETMKKWRINVNEGVRKGYPHLYIIVNFLPVLIYFFANNFPNK